MLKYFFVLLVTTPMLTASHHFGTHNNKPPVSPLTGHTVSFNDQTFEIEEAGIAGLIEHLLPLGEEKPEAPQNMPLRADQIIYWLALYQNTRQKLLLGFLKKQASLSNELKKNGYHNPLKALRQLQQGRGLMMVGLNYTFDEITPMSLAEDQKIAVPPMYYVNKIKEHKSAMKKILELIDGSGHDCWHVIETALRKKGALCQPSYNELQSFLPLQTKFHKKWRTLVANHPKLILSGVTAITLVASCIGYAKGQNSIPSPEEQTEIAVR